MFDFLDDIIKDNVEIFVISESKVVNSFPDGQAAYFQKFIGDFDFLRIIVAVTKIHFPKMKPQVVSYRKYEDFQNETFSGSLRHELNVQEWMLN